MKPFIIMDVWKVPLWKTKKVVFLVSNKEQTLTFQPRAEFSLVHLTAA